MAVSPELLEQLLKLDEYALSELITLLASSKEDQLAAIDQLNDAQSSPLDNMPPEERAALERAFARAEADIRAGRVYSMEQVMEQLQAKRVRPRVAAR